VLALIPFFVLASLWSSMMSSMTPPRQAPSPVLTPTVYVIRHEVRPNAAARVMYLRAPASKCCLVR
jgi:hypothetical protein